MIRSHGIGEADILEANLAVQPLLGYDVATRQLHLWLQREELKDAAARRQAAYHGAQQYGALRERPLDALRGDQEGHESAWRQALCGHQVAAHEERRQDEGVQEEVGQALEDGDAVA